MKYKVAYIDEEPEDRDMYSELLTCDKLHIEPIDPFSELETFIDHLINEKFNAIIVDYTLYAKRTDIKYNGVELVNSLWEKREDFPAFILTNNRDERSVDSKIESTKVFIKKQVSEGAVEIQHKIKKEIDFYLNENERFKSELNELLEKKDSNNGLNDNEIQKIHDLNKIIENRININKGFTDIIRDSENLKKLSNILDEAESILKNINNDE